jgi:hypothetical protein
VIQNFKIDQARTFVTLMLLGVSPKTVFGDNYRQELTKAGVPRWVAQFAAEFRAFGRPVRELINVGIDAERDPGEGIAPGTFMELIDFEIGVMEKTRRDQQSGQDRVVGVQVWYRAASMRPTSAVPGNGRPRPAAAEAVGS